MRRLAFLALAGLLTSPALAINYDISMTAFSATGSISGNNFSISRAGSSSTGSIPVDGSGNITGGSVTSTLRFTGTSGALNGLVIDMPRTWVLIKDGHPFWSPIFDSTKGYQQYDPAQFSLATIPGDPIPPAAKMGKDGANTVGTVTINLVLWDMTSVASRTPIVGGGETIVYNVSGNLNLVATGLGTFNPGFSGTMTLTSVPEPFTAMLLALALPLLRRRR